MMAPRPTNIFDIRQQFKQDVLTKKPAAQTIQPTTPTTTTAPTAQAQTATIPTSAEQEKLTRIRNELKQKRAELQELKSRTSNAALWEGKSSKEYNMAYGFKSPADRIIFLNKYIDRWGGVAYNIENPEKSRDLTREAEQTGDTIGPIYNSETFNQRGSFETRSVPAYSGPVSGKPSGYYISPLTGREVIVRQGGGITTPKESRPSFSLAPAPKSSFERSYTVTPKTPKPEVVVDSQTSRVITGLTTQKEQPKPVEPSPYTGVISAREEPKGVLETSERWLSDASNRVSTLEARGENTFFTGAASFGIGVGKAVTGTARFGYELATDPVGTTTDFFKGGYYLVTNPGKTGSMIGEAIRKKPSETAGLVIGEFYTGKLLGRVAKASYRLGENIYTRALDPRYIKVVDEPGTLGTLDVPTTQGSQKVKLAGSIGSDTLPTQSLREQAGYAGQEVLAASGQRGLFGWFKNKITVNKPKPAPDSSDLETSFFADPEGRLRPSRLALENPGEASMADILSGNVQFGSGKPQGVIFPNAPVERFPPELADIRYSLLSNKPLTPDQGYRFYKFQLTPSGQFKPVGFLGGEPEITLPIGEVIERVKTGARVTVPGPVDPNLGIQTGFNRIVDVPGKPGATTIINGRRVEIIEARILDSANIPPKTNFEKIIASITPTKSASPKPYITLRAPASYLGATFRSPTTSPIPESPTSVAIGASSGSASVPTPSSISAYISPRPSPKPYYFPSIISPSPYSPVRSPPVGYSPVGSPVSPISPSPSSPVAPSPYAPSIPPYSPPPPSTPLPPPISPTPPMKRRRRKEEIEGFRAFAKVGGAFVPVSRPMSKQGAITAGARFTVGSAAATFEIRPSGRISKEEEEIIPRSNYNSLLSQFRVPGRDIGKSKKENPYSNLKSSTKRFVEQTRYRIDTPGELTGITAKGIRASRIKRLRL